MTGRDDFSELISAFLDGEVTPEQQARVEERLVDNAEDRRLFEEMRAMRNGLQSLPRRELDRDLSEIILRRAERVMLANETPRPGDGSAEPPPVAEDRERSAAAIVGHMPKPPEPASWRPLIWVGLTVAAAVLVMTLARPWFDESREVAHETTGENDFAAPAGSDSSRSRSFDDNTVEDAARGISVAAAKQEADADSTGTGELKTDHFRHSQDPRPGGEDVAGWEGLPEFGGQTVEGQDAAEGMRWDIEQDNKRRATAAAGTQAQSSENRPDTGRPEATTLALRGNPTALGGIRQLDFPSDRVLLVRLDLSPEAVRTGSFDRSLSRNEIHYGPSAEQLLKVREAFAVSDGESGEFADGVALKDFERKAGKDLLARVDRSDMQLVCVVATEAKVRALLEDFEQQPESFRIVDVDPGPGSAELKGVARKLAAAPMTAPAERFSRQDGGAPADKPLADSRSAEIDELEEEAAPVEAETPRSPREPADAPLARKPSMVPAPAVESAAEPDFDADDGPVPEPVAEQPALPELHKALGRDETQPAPTAPPAGRPLGSRAGLAAQDGAVAANSAPEALSEEAASAAEDEASMGPAGGLQQARGGGESKGGRSDSEEEETRDAEKETPEKADSRGRFGEATVAGKTPGSPEDEKKSGMANAPAKTDAEGEPSAEVPDALAEPKLDSRGAADAENDDAFGAIPVPGLRQEEHEGAARRTRSGEDHPGFAQRLEMPQRKPQSEIAKKKAAEDRAKAEQKRVNAADPYSRDGDGEGGGGSAPAAPVVTPRPARQNGAGQAYSFDGRNAVPSDGPAPERLVRVLFVIRAVEPIADLAADVPAEEPPASEVIPLAAPPAAASEAFEAEIEPAGPAEP